MRMFHMSSQAFIAWWSTLQFDSVSMNFGTDSAGRSEVCLSEEEKSHTERCVNSCLLAFWPT